MSLIEKIISTSDQINNNRNIQSVLRAATSELGELAVEVDIESGTSYKTPSPDGVIGEALDTIIALVDLIHVYSPDLTEDDLATLAQKKLDKWIHKTNTKGGGNETVSE